ncbi:N-acetylglucosamine-6-phosphate deacetylase [Bifidobacterium vespertilionis]|uniref:N-acetylglucosamine-6-phosphate deacetylase n=1 Tax=Bifidobacterium vespertilionis TaxID=2562524 RepID=UPI001BDD7AE8|nr:N-acetylglucosamine-6-phosphate deacetylase [Bifidobacterium vespertilionis]MBT1179366.1 N-acetylglucosamine-6-phosphate deacetylase [Bifidobacterium vespertilionis]
MVDPIHQAQAKATEDVFASPAGTFVIRNAVKADAQGVDLNAWVSVVDGTIDAVGTGDADCETRIAHLGGTGRVEVVDAGGMLVTPGYVDIHVHGAWECSFDDGAEAISVARAHHMLHGTTRQVLSLITNPLDVMERNLRSVRDVMASRPDVLGSHLEGPFLALSRKGAHDPNCLVDPTPERVERLLGAADGTLRQVTLAPEREHGMEAIRRFAAAGVVPAVGHCDADYDTARRAFDAGARLMTHMFNAMNGLHHREPGPIPAAVEDPRVTIELINDGFHVQDPMLRLGLGFAKHRIAFVTDAMAATGCADGAYKLGALDVNVVDGHARLVSNGTIAGSTLILEAAVQRAVHELGMGLTDALEAASLTPARAFGFDRPNPVTGAPLGLIAPGYAADLLLTDPGTLGVCHVWCAGRRMR